MMENMQDDLAETDVTEDEVDAMLTEGEPVAVTGPPVGAARRVRFELVHGNLHTFGWRLVAADGEVLATSAVTYRTRTDVRRALSTLAAMIPNAPVVEDDSTEPVGRSRRGWRRWRQRRAA
ncbi:MAG: DUF1508 domain-containing protein [Micromonosporaceae bacterium]|nr:DUF1508 domain-containing protein [Micromonosporaceae bacterium]